MIEKIAARLGRMAARFVEGLFLGLGLFLALETLGIDLIILGG